MFFPFIYIPYEITQSRLRKNEKEQDLRDEEKGSNQVHITSADYKKAGISEKEQDIQNRKSLKKIEQDYINTKLKQEEENRKIGFFSTQEYRFKKNKREKRG